MFRLLETDIREQKKYERKTQTSADNTVNDLRYEVKTKITFLLSETLLFLLEQKYILFSGTYFFKIPKNKITSGFFLSMQILKNIDMTRQKPQMLHW